MTLKLKDHIQNLRFLLSRPDDMVQLCKISFDYLVDANHNSERLEILAKNSGTNINTIEALISLLILNTNGSAFKNLEKETDLKPEVLEILSQFFISKRSFLESSIKSANLRAYRIVRIEWRLETKFSSRCLLKQSNVSVIMKLYLHTEPKNENRDLLTEGENNIIHTEERRNRKDILVQTDINSLEHMIQTLEDALIESRTRRIRNIVDAIH